jgi:hypothetical protein
MDLSALLGVLWQYRWYIRAGGLLAGNRPGAGAWAALALRTGSKPLTLPT